MPTRKRPRIGTGETRARMRTRLIHGRQRTARWEYDHHVVPPITATVTFRLESAERGALGFEQFGHAPEPGFGHPPIYIYDRLDEPTCGMLEENLATAESGEMALCFASGMAAISATLGTLVKAGEHIVAHHVLYGCTYSLMTNWLPRLGVEVAFADLIQPENLREVIRPQTRVVYFETPVNPDLSLVDIAAVRAVVDEFNADRPPEERIWVVVDNTFASPYCQRPLELGADVVCLSLTKAVGGFGTDIGGAVVGPHSLRSRLLLFRKDWGGCLSPRAAWNVLVYGLPSLAARMVNYQKSAQKVAEFLEGHPRVACVRYPGLASFPQAELARRQMVSPEGRFAPGSMLYFVLADNDESGDAGRRFVDYIAQNAYAITLAVSLGQVKTLIECPYSMTHSAMPPEQKRAHGLVPNGIRLSVGLEDYHDLIADLKEALEAI